MSVSITFIQRKSFRERVWKTLNLVVGITTLLNVSMVGTFIQPQVATAQTITEGGTSVQSTQTVSTVSQPTPATNPALGQSCGLDIGLIIDTSGSVDSTEMASMKTAMSSFAGAFTGTPTQFSLTKFSDNSSTPIPFTGNLVTVQAGINGLPASGSGSTNWDSGLQRSQASFGGRPDKANLIVIATDGSPNRYGYPVAAPEADWSLPDNWVNGLNHAITAANAIKTTGTRVVVVAIGSDPSDPSYNAGDPTWNNPKLTAISGPTIATTPAAITTATDVIKVTDFTGIGDAVAAYAKALCGGKILVQKQFDTNGDGQADVTTSDPLLNGWQFDVNGSASNPAPQTTTNTGSLQFDNVLNGSGYSVLETQKANTKLVSAICLNGNQQVGTVNLQTGIVSDLTMGTDDTISCTFVNAPAKGSLKVTKVVTGGSAKPEQFGFRLGDSGPYTYPAADQNLVIFDNLQPGSVSVNETTGALPYHQTGNTCTNVTIVAGNQATCTVTNARDTGTVTFRKVISGEVKSDVSPFIFTANGHQYHSGASDTFDTGTYGLTENSVPGYHFVSASGICSVNSDHNIVLDVTANGGICIITNARDTGSVTVNKKLDSDGNGTFETTNPENFRWILDGGAPHAMGSTVGNVLIGDHDITENSPANYHFVGWYTTGSEQFSCANPEGTTLPVTVAVNKNATASITLCNARDTGTVIVHKLLDTNNDGQIDQTDPAGWFWGVDNGQSHIAMGGSATVPTGSVSLTEEQHADYHNVSWACYIGDTKIANGTGETIHLDLTTKGITCWFTNARDVGTITVHKLVDAAGNGTFNAGDAAANLLGFDWQLDGGSDNEMGTSLLAATGSHSINENISIINGYHFVGGYINGSERQFSCANPQFTELPIPVSLTTGNVTVTLCNSHDTGSIDGYKWNDRNGNGVWDDGGLVIPGVEIETLHGLTATTDANGYYRIDNVPTGHELVLEWTQAGWVQTNTDVTGLGIDVVKGKTSRVNFGNFKLGSISGLKFNDLNGNGSQNSGELGLANWTILLERFDSYYFAHPELYGANDGYLQVDSTVTDVSGHYSFINLGPGKYRVREVQKGGWTQTSTNPSDINPLISGQNQTDVNFGNFKLGKISGFKFDTQENKLNGWSICLNGIENCVITGSGKWPTGYYEFTNITPGTYTLYEHLQSGWQAVSPVGGEYENVVIDTSGTELTKNFVNTRNTFNVDITKTSQATVEAGAQLTYTLAWSISGNIPVNNVVITDPIGSNANMSFASATCGTTTGICVMSNVAGTESWSLGTRNPGDSGTVTVTVAVTSPLVNATTLSNTGTICGTGNLIIDLDHATLAAQQVSGTEKCDHDTSTTQVHSAPIITILKTGPATVAASQNLTDTLTWSVSGNAVATNAIITDTIPANSTFVASTCGTTVGTCVMSAVAGTISWSLGSRHPGETGTVTITLKAASPIPNGTLITNTGTFDTTENTPVNNTATTIIQSAPSLTIVKSNDVIGFTNPGKQVTYTVTVTNAAGASDAAHAVILTDVLPAGFTYLIGGGSTKSFTLGEMAPGVSIVTTYVVNISDAQATGVYTNTATAKGSNTTNAIATSNVDVRVPSVLGATAVPTLVLTKTVDTNVTNPGKTVTYTVIISNAGDIDLTNVRLSDKLPKGFTFVDSDQGTKTWDIGGLKAHHQRIIDYPVKIGDAVKAGHYQNLATVLSNELDPQTAKANVEVKVPHVLGLATTGVSMRDYALFTFGFGLMSLGLYWVARLRRQANGTDLV